MKPPTEFQLEQLMHDYDPQKAHEYYMRIRQLKGRKKGSAQPPPPQSRAAKNSELNSPRFQQKIKLQQSITNLQAKLVKLQQLISQKEATLKQNASRNKGKARSKKDTPKTAADKAKAARDNKKYRDAHKQQLKTKASQSSHKSGSSKTKKGGKSENSLPIADLKALATRVKGELAIAKEKLAAL